MKLIINAKINVNIRHPELENFMATFVESMTAAFADQTADSEAKFGALTDVMTQKFSDLQALVNSIDQGVEDLFTQLDTAVKGTLSAADQTALLAAVATAKANLASKVEATTTALSSDVDALRTAENKILTQDNAPGAAPTTKVGTSVPKP